MGEGYAPTNVRALIALDALHSVWPIASADGIICINMIHISPWEATLGLMRGAAAILLPGSLLYALTDAAYDAIASTLPKGAARWPMQRDRGQCFIQVEAAVVDRMRAMRRPS